MTKEVTLIVECVSALYSCFSQESFCSANTAADTAQRSSGTYYLVVFKGSVPYPYTIQLVAALSKPRNTA